MTNFTPRIMFDQAREIYGVVGDNSFTIEDLPKDVPTDRNRKTLCKMESRGYLVQVSRATHPRYKIHPRIVARINADLIFADQQTKTDLENKLITYTQISIETGYSIHTVQNRLKQE